MANKYIAQNGDVTALGASQVYTQAPFSEKFTGESSLQKAGTNTTNVELTGFKIDGTTCSVVKKGYMPTMNLFHYIFSSGYYTLSRTDTALTIGSTTFTPDKFRDGVVPHEIIVLAVGGGGGGGGNGYYEVEKDTFKKLPGGAGSAGGKVVGRLNFDKYSTYNLRVGGGGSAGSDGASDSNSKGWNGNSGGDTYVLVDGSNYYTFLGKGGGGGEGGVGNCTEWSSCRAGGTGNDYGGWGVANESYGGTYSVNSHGGYGNINSNTSRSGTTALNYTTTEGTGAPVNEEVAACLAYSNNGSNGINITCDVSKLPDGGSEFYLLCGGCSRGYGGRWSQKYTAGVAMPGQYVYNEPNYGGGGGASSSGAKAGAGGLLFFFY